MFAFYQLCFLAKIRRSACRWPLCLKAIKQKSTVNRPMATQTETLHNIFNLYLSVGVARYLNIKYGLINTTANLIVPLLTHAEISHFSSARHSSWHHFGRWVHLKINVSSTNIVPLYLGTHIETCIHNNVIKHSAVGLSGSISA